MANGEKSFPLNNTLYDASDMRLFLATRTSGIFANGHLAVTANGSMSVTVAKGIAWLRVDEFGGIAYANTTPLSLPIDTPDQQLKRIDRVVIRYSAANNTVKAMISKGTPAQNPVPPALHHTPGGDIYEISLAQVEVPAGTIAITTNLVNDETLDPDVCGYMEDAVTAINTESAAQEEARLKATGVALREEIAQFKVDMEGNLDTWQAQQQAAFTTWFDGIKATLGDDPTAGLASEVQSLRADMGAKYGGKTKAISVSSASWSTVDDETVQATITDSDIPADANGSVVLVTYNPAYRAPFLECGVYGYSHSAGRLVLRAGMAPESTITINVMILDKGLTV